MISKKDILRITKCNEANLDKHYDSFVDTCNKYDINTDKRIAAFLANVLHETNNLKTFEENLNYSKEGLMKVFPKRFNAELAAQYAKNPEAIANNVYFGRYGNVDVGDGWKYRGRGAFQYTFKANYDMVSKAFKVDFVKNPDLLKEAPYAMLSAGFYWKTHKLNHLADIEDLDRICVVINGGYNGLEHRKELYNKLIQG